jgi:hypothetical protein
LDKFSTSCPLKVRKENEKKLANLMLDPLEFEVATNLSLSIMDPPLIPLVIPYFYP